MSISSSLNAGVAGLSANATRLATISDNIANSGTYGYKRASADFESFVISERRTAGTYSAGGVRAITGRLIDERGAMVSTSNALDMAIAGRGMLPVMQAVALNNTSGGQPLLMTTTGSFRTDAEGVLTTPSGLVLLGWPAQANGTVPVLPRDTTAGLVPVVINANQTAGDPTTEMNLGVNLPATDTEAGQSGAALPLSVEYFGNLGTSETLDITFTPTVPATGSSNTWTMEIRDSAQGGALIGEYTLVFDDTRGNGGTLASVTTVSGGAYNGATGELASDRRRRAADGRDRKAWRHKRADPAVRQLCPDGDHQGRIAGRQPDGGGDRRRRIHHGDLRHRVHPAAVPDSAGRCAQPERAGGAE